MLEKQQKLFYEQGELIIEVIDNEAPVPASQNNAKSSGLKRSRRRRKRRQKNSVSNFSIIVDSKDKLSFIKLKIYECYEVAPGQMRLFHGRRELIDPMQSLKDYEIEDGSTLYLKVDSTKSSECNFAGMLPEERSSKIETGFGGSVLASTWLYDEIG
jgi:hypothetical protein